MILFNNIFDMEMLELPLDCVIVSGVLSRSTVLFSIYLGRYQRRNSCEDSGLPVRTI